MILGVSGLNGAGKGEVVRYLEARSFYPYSLSDVIRDVLRDRGQEETRERMIETGNEIRAERGPGGLAQILAERLAPDRNYVVDSIRHPAEVDVLRSRTQSFRLLWVTADEATRLERIRARARGGDPDTLAELRRLEGRELASEDPGGQQLLLVRDLADFTLENDGSLQELESKVQEVLERSYFFERPGWDEYFMSIARVVASRSNCVKRKVAAVITKDRRIISTGYNGTPRGTPNCNEGGCPRCNGFAEGGTRLDECLCSHGEENAITQAAYHGVNVNGGTIYTTFSPCLTCTKMIINAGLVEVAYNVDYPLGDVSLDLLREAGVKIRQVELPERLSTLVRGRTGIALLTALLCAGAAGSEESPERLLERAFANLYADDYVQTLELTSGAGVRPLSRTLQITRKQSVRPGKALVRFLEPFDVRRTSVLILENEGANDDLYVYLPAIGLTRRLSAAQRADAFFGTDLSYEDVEPKHASDWEVRILPGDASADEDCVRLEITPAPGFESTYDEMVSCIERERALIHWTDFHRHGRPVKRLEIDLSRVEPVGERFVPFRMTVRTLRTGSETRVETLSYERTGEIPDALFSTWNLEAGDADRDRAKAKRAPGP